jgi:uncharacterized protein YjiS (DUF1127 family)
MPHKFDFDRYLRDFHSLTPGQRDAVVRRVVREAKAERAAVMRDFFRLLGSRTWAAGVRGYRSLRPAGAAALGLIGAGWRRYQRRRRRRIAAARLHAMDDRMLKDIGLRRGEIDFVLSGIEDPTRLPRPPIRLAARPKLSVIASAGGSRPRAQRADALVSLRKACAG